MTSTPADTVRPSPTPPPRRGRHRVALIAGGSVLLLAATAGAVAFGVTTASSLREETATESFSGVRELVVDVDEGRISLSAGTGPDVAVRTTRVFGPGYEPVVRQQLVDGVLTLTSDCPSFNLGCEVEQQVVVPAGTVVTARAVDGGIEAVGLDVPRFGANSVDGSVTADFVRPPDDVRVQTVAGAVRVSVPVAPYRIAASAVAGPVTVGLDADPAAQRAITVRTVAGPVEVSPR